MLRSGRSTKAFNFGHDDDLEYVFVFIDSTLMLIRTLLRLVFVNLHMYPFAKNWLPIWSINNAVNSMGTKPDMNTSQVALSQATVKMILSYLSSLDNE